MNNAPVNLSKAKLASLVAPAGAGKTEVIVDSVALGSGRELVLTHTHAGLQSLKSRFKKKGISQKRYRVETIAGISLRFSSSFPRLSQVDLSKINASETDWNHIYKSMSNLLGKNVLKKILRASYSGIYVDEYQDCTLEQHELIKLLSNYLPCRVLGDPLQGIFDFGGNKIVNWRNDVIPHFPLISAKSLPRRWEKHNRLLGNWLQEVRRSLISGQQIDLTNLPNGVVWHKSQHNPMDLITLCKYGLPANGSVLVIRNVANQCHALAKSLGGQFKSMEEIESKDLSKWVLKIGSSKTGLDKVVNIMQLTKDCVTNFSELSSFLKKAENNGISYKSRKYPELTTLIDKILIENNYSLDLSLMLLCEKILGKRKFYRIELWSEIKRAINHYLGGKSKSLFDSAIIVRNQTRVMGRPFQRKVVSRTLLVKGLEFDHVVVVDADELNAKNLYVALTRARETLHIWSKTPVLKPNN